MAIDFSFPTEIEQVRQRVRGFLDPVLQPAGRAIEAYSKHGSVRTAASDLPL